MIESFSKKVKKTENFDEIKGEREDALTFFAQDAVLSIHTRREFIEELHITCYREEWIYAYFV